MANFYDCPDFDSHWQDLLNGIANTNCPYCSCKGIKETNQEPVLQEVSNG